MNDDESSDEPWCMCGPRHGRQDGYTCIDVERNFWGCGGCRKPTKLYYEKIIKPYEDTHVVTATA